MLLTAGSDTYGRVKTVDGIPIVTKFFMFQFLPIYPLESFYFFGTSQSKTSGIPFIATSSTTTLHGIPLATVDRLSSMMAYIRSAFATLAIVGFLVIVPGIMHLSGEFLDSFALLATKGLAISFVVGVLGGILTYIIPLTTRRERDIRLVCKMLLGIAIDPARIAPEAAEVISLYMDSNFGAEMPIKAQEETAYQLIQIRLNIALHREVDSMEVRTDQLLTRISEKRRPQDNKTFHTSRG